MQRKRAAVEGKGGGDYGTKEGPKSRNSGNMAVTQGTKYSGASEQ